MLSDPQCQSLVHHEGTYILQWWRHCQIHSVDHLYTMGRPTRCNEKEIVRFTVSIARTESGDLHPVTKKRLSDPDINHSYTMIRLAYYHEEDVIKFTVSITRTQWADLHSTMRKLSDPWCRPLVHNEQTYILQRGKGCRHHSVNHLYTMSWLTSCNEGNGCQTHGVDHTYTKSRLTYYHEETSSNPKCQSLVRSGPTYILQWGRWCSDL